MGISIGINVCEAHGPWEAEVEEEAADQDDAADGVAKQNFRMMGKMHRVPGICWNMTSSIQQTKIT